MNIFRHIGRQKEKGPTIAERLAEVLRTRKKLLFVEDDEMLQRFICELVPNRYDAEVITTHSVAEARALLDDERITAVVLDYRLTNGDGVALYREIMQRRPDIQAIFLTGYFSDDLRREIESVGPARVFSKDRLMDLSFIDTLLMHLGIRALPECEQAPKLRLLSRGA